MNKNNINPSLFLDDEIEEVKLTPEKVVCLGMEFENEDARRAYFREELRKKLPELKQIEGFPIGEDDDIINLSDPPYYTACPNPWLNDFIQEWEKEKVQLEKAGKRKKKFEVREPYASDVSEGKNNPIYMAHAYHTKVPHPAIMRYILHYTEPGDIIFDGFGGTGMTGVAAGMCEHSGNKNDGVRHCICNDLSPIASFITFNYNNPLSIRESRICFEKVMNKVKEEYSFLYQTKHSNGAKAEILFVIWSEVFICPNCQNDVIYFSNAINSEKYKVVDEFKCPHCASVLSKATMTKKHEANVGNNGKDIYEKNCIIPVLIKYRYDNKTYYKKPDDEDFKLLQKIQNQVIPNKIPDKILPKGVKTNELIRNGRKNVADLYTKRNLMILSALWENALNYPLVRFAITAILVKTGSLLHNVGFKDGKINLAGALPNALFIPSILAERNIFELLEGKFEDILKMNPSTLHRICNQVQSATDLSNIKSNTIDYIFTDPPFGHNLMYSELNFIHEAWLGVTTENTEEAIECSAQNKNVFDYQKLMERSFCEFYRILKPGKWMTVEFSNTSAAVWNSIQTSLKSAGFAISVVRGLDKQQGSFNAQTSPTAVKQDLVISCYKPSYVIASREIKSKEDCWDFVEELLVHLPVHQEKDNNTTSIIERSPKILYDRLISYYVQHGYAIPMDAQEFQKGLREHFIERDRMFFTASQALEYEEKKKGTNGIVPMALLIGTEAEGIEWLKRELETPQTYSEIQPEWMKNMIPVKKGDILPELMTILEENFIKDEDGKWRKPDPEKAADLEIIRNRKMMKEFNMYLEQAQKPKAKRMKDTRLEVLRYGFKECYKQKDYKSIILVGDHIQESLLQEDEVLLQYYDIASTRV